MTSDSFDFDFPTDPPLPPPPPEDPSAIQQWQAERLAEFYQSSHFDEWYRRTSEEMRDMEPFVM